jgi:hypothetical protein
LHGTWSKESKARVLGGLKIGGAGNPFAFFPFFDGSRFLLPVFPFIIRLFHGEDLTPEGREAGTMRVRLDSFPEPTFAFDFLTDAWCPRRLECMNLTARLFSLSCMQGAKVENGRVQS